MLVDVVHWRETGLGCDRCAGAADHYVTPYWASNKRICGLCCSELERVYDQHGWPPGGFSVPGLVYPAG